MEGRREKEEVDGAPTGEGIERTRRIDTKDGGHGEREREGGKEGGRERERGGGGSGRGRDSG